MVRLQRATSWLTSRIFRVHMQVSLGNLRRCRGRTNKHQSRPNQTLFTTAVTSTCLNRPLFTQKETLARSEVALRHVCFANNVSIDDITVWGLSPPLARDACAGSAFAVSVGLLQRQVRMCGKLLQELQPLQGVTFANAFCCECKHHAPHLKTLREGGGGAAVFRTCKLAC